MKNYIILCKEKDHQNITMFSNLTFTQADRLIPKLKKDGASSIQLRKLAIGRSSVLVG